MCIEVTMETKVIYHVNDEDTPYLVKLPVPSDRVTLGDLKNVLQRTNCKYFFKSMDDDFGVVKEEIVDDTMRLPCFNGRVVSWLVSTDGSTSDKNSQCAESLTGTEQQSKTSIRPSPSRSVGCKTDGGVKTGATKPPVSQMRSGQRHTDLPVRRIIGSEFSGRSSVLSSDIETTSFVDSDEDASSSGRSSVLSSDIETTSFVDSDEDASSRMTGNTETTATSRFEQRLRHQRRRKHKPHNIGRTSSFSSITDSTLSLNIISITLNMDAVNFLGISIVGHSNRGGDGGIYVGSIMKGGAIAVDGRIEPGDMLLEVNGVSFENMSNDEAVMTLREAVHKRGPVQLVVAKCWDSPGQQKHRYLSQQFGGYGGSEVWGTGPPSSVWISKADAARQAIPTGKGFDYGRAFSDITSSSCISSSVVSSSLYPHHPVTGLAYTPQPQPVPLVAPSPQPQVEELKVEGQRLLSTDQRLLSTECEMIDVVRAAARADSGLDIRDRMWLKITIPRAFIGSELVDWLQTHVKGLSGIDRREARRYASNMLRSGYIRHTVNKTTFSEQCYYVFAPEALSTVTLQPWQPVVSECGVTGETDWKRGGGDLWESAMKNLSSLTLDDIDSVSEVGKYRHARPRLPSSSSSNNHHHPFLPPHPFPPPTPPHNSCWIPNPFAVQPVNHMSNTVYAGPPPSYSHVIGGAVQDGRGDASGGSRAGSCPLINARPMTKSKSLSGSSTSSKSSRKTASSGGGRTSATMLAPPYSNNTGAPLDVSRCQLQPGSQWHESVGYRMTPQMTPVLENPHSVEGLEMMGDV